MTLRRHERLALLVAGVLVFGAVPLVYQQAYAGAPRAAAGAAITTSAASAASAGGTPVVVALYTSEGCSSCPPADALLTRLEREQPLAGVRIVPLELHVDYWDAIGWKDPFDSADFTARQNAFASAHGSNHMYTPEAVVDGAVDVVGSDENALKARIAEAAKRPKVPLRASFGGRGLVVDVPAFGGPSEVVPATLRVAWVQGQASVAVLRGENGGRTLEHTAIVRQLTSMGTVGFAGGHLETSAPAGADAHLYPVVLLESGNKSETLGVAVLAR